jgi:hypothetical protein
MTKKTLPASAFGLSWVLPEAGDLITKSLAPSFVFVDYETFINTNVRHRLAKRSIDAYVSMSAPYTLLASLYGWEEAAQIVMGTKEKKALDRATDYISHSITTAADAGADALVFCDDLCGTSSPLPDPLFVMENLIPLYACFVQEADAVGLPLVFHSDGDIHEYYAGIAQAGFAGVHIAHPSFEQTRALFESAREQDLIPLGGLIAAHATNQEVDKLSDFAIDLAHSGPVLICDDGEVSTKEQFEHVITVLANVRATCS